MATVTTSTGSRARLSQRRLVHQEPSSSGSRPSSSPALSLSYSHSVLVSFQIEPRRMLPLLPKGLEPELIRSGHYINVVATHYRRSAIWGLPLVPAFNSLVLSTNVRAAANSDLKGKFVFRRRISQSMAAWQLQRKLDLKPDVSDINWNAASNSSSSLPAVNFTWKAREAANYLKVKARSRIGNVLQHPKARWILDHRSEFAISQGPDLQENLRIHHALPDTKCKVYDVAQAGFKCDALNLFGAEFTKAIARRASSVILMCGGTKAFTSGEVIES